MARVGLSGVANLVTEGLTLLTTSLVLLECGNAAARKPYRGRLAEIRRQFLADGTLTRPSEADSEVAWAAYERGEAGQAGIVDHVSFVVMRRLGLTRAFTNDAHSGRRGSSCCSNPG